MRQKATSLLLSLGVTCCLSLCFAADPAKPGIKPAVPKKSGMPQIYEKEETTSSITDVVKMVRQDEDVIEVMFEKKLGIHHAAKNASMLRDLQKSQKGKIPVSVKIDDDDQILSVELKEAPKKGGSDEYDEQELQKLMKKIGS